MVNYMTLDEQVDADFTRARQRVFLRRVVTRLRGGSSSARLVSFESVRKGLGAYNKVRLGRRAVPVERIIGSVGRYEEFDPAFLPARASVGAKWKRIDRAFHRGEELPPVRLYKLGNAYFVEDGNHRVSVARYQGVQWIDAEVTALGNPSAAAQWGAGCRAHLERGGTHVRRRVGRSKHTERTGGMQMTTQPITRSALVGKVLILGVLVAMILAGLEAARPAYADVAFTVNNSGDGSDLETDASCDASPADGRQCTLRAAIQESNLTFDPGSNIIRFDIPSDGSVKIISPETPLPTIREQVVIDGYTQLGASPSTSVLGNDALIKVQLDGSDLVAAGSNASGLEIRASGVVVRGLSITRFGGSGIALGAGSGSRIEGNYIGTDPSGALDRGNAIDGVNIFGATNTSVGGFSPAARNIISANDTHGVELSGSTGGNQVVGNFIGTKRNGLAALGNKIDGVSILGASGNFVGGGSAGAANTIAFNGRAGVGVNTSGGISNNANGNRILGNATFLNGGPGIDLGNNGLTANDAGDGDVGPNGLQNKPTLTSAKNRSAGTSIKGKLASTPNAFFAIQFYSSPSGSEGKKFIGEATVNTDASGNATFRFAPDKKVPSGQVVTATATKNISNDTSEFSAVRKVVAA